MKKTIRKRRKTNWLFFKTRSSPQLKNRLTQGLMFLFILFLPIQLGKHFFFSFSYLSGVRVDYLAPTFYLTDLIFLFLIFLNYPLLFKEFRRLWWFFIILIINIAAAISKPISFYSSLRILQLLTVFFLFKKIKISSKTVLLAFTGMGAVELFLSVGQIFFNRSIQGVFYFLGERYFTLGTPGIAKASFNGVEFLRPYATFSHPNSLAGFYLLVYFFVLTKKEFSQFFYLKSFSLFIFTLLVLISFSKLAIITFLTLNIIYFIFSSKINCFPCLLSRLILLTVTSVMFLQTKGDPLTLIKRGELIKNSLLIILKYPFFGVGLGNYLVAQNQLVLKHFFFLNQPVHNIFLLFFAQVGLPLSFYIFFRLFLTFKKKAFVLFYLFLIIFITGMFDHYWLTLPQNFLLMGAVLGLALN